MYNIHIKQLKKLYTQNIMFNKIKVLKMDEQRKIQIIVILDYLKDVINPAYDNDIYQLWLKTDKKIKFRSWCIDKIKEQILMELDAPDLNNS